MATRGVAAGRVRRAPQTRPREVMSDAQRDIFCEEAKDIGSRLDATDWRQYDDDLRDIPGFRFPRGPLRNDPDFKYERLFQNPGDAAIVLGLLSLTGTDDDHDPDVVRETPVAWLYELFPEYGALLDPNWKRNSRGDVSLATVNRLPFRWMRSSTQVLLDRLNDILRQRDRVPDDELWDEDEHADQVWKYWSVGDLTKVVRMFSIARLRQTQVPGYRNFDSIAAARTRGWDADDVSRLRIVMRAVDTINKLLGDP